MEQRIQPMDRPAANWFSPHTDVLTLIKILTLCCTGRVPTARVYDSVIFAIDTMQGPNGPVTGYVFGGTFGGFKIDVLKYIPLKNRFANLYALVCHLLHVPQLPEVCADVRVLSLLHAHTFRRFCM